MTSVLSSPLLATVGHESVDLPLPALAFGVIALAVFLGLLGLLWSFRNTLALDPRQHGHHDDLDGPGPDTTASHH